MPTRRRVAVLLALAGAAVAAYLTLVQAGVVDHAWDPLFGDGSDAVLHSSFSEALPFPDAAAGLVAYLLEAGLGVSGTGDRWARRPVLGLGFDAVGLGLGVAAVGLVLLQATVVGDWCLLCLGSAAVSLSILAIGRLHEARRAIRRITNARRDGASWPGALVDSESLKPDRTGPRRDQDLPPASRGTSAPR
jgi:uncharacterized membrane protein